MKIRRDLLSAVGLNEYAKITSLTLVILFLSSIGIFADSIVDIIEKQDFLKFAIALTLFVLVFLIYRYLGNKELKMIQRASLGKQKMILVFPSNLDLLKKIIHFHNLDNIYFIKTKGFPDEETFQEINKYLKSANIDTHISYIDDKNNAKEIKEKFSFIVEKINNLNDTVVNITTGNSISSLVLSECAYYNGMDVEYLSSEYDKFNKPIKSSEKSFIIDFKEEFVK